MDERTLSQLGAPDLELAGFQLWVHGYAYPDVRDAWDGNWLRVTAHAGVAGASVWVRGTVLDTVSVLRFRRGLAAVYETLAGEATLESQEPNLVVRVTAADRAGHLSVRADLTPEHLAQGHWFEFGADQTYLPQVIAGCDALLDRLPVRNPAERGV